MNIELQNRDDMDALIKEEDKDGEDGGRKDGLVYNLRAF